MTDHLEALEDLLIGVRMDASYDPSSREKIAALKAAIALMRGQSEPKLACYGLRKKGETGVIGLIPEKVHKVKPTSEEFLRDYEEVPLYFSPAQPKDTADEQ